MLAEIAKTLKDRGVDSHFLPKCHFSGCPSNCAVQQTAALGLRGAAKKVGDAMEPAFNIYAGGSYARYDYLEKPAGFLPGLERNPPQSKPALW